MDNAKIGSLIYRLRKEKGYTQLQLADILNISDKTISKWERGQGCPDILLLKSLSEVFGVDMEKLLAGELDENKKSAGNMRKMNFYICPVCGNIITSLNDTTFSCCGKKLTAETLQKAEEKLNIELIENEYYVTTSHPMTREHYISFVAVLTGDSLFIKKTYPEWDLQTRIPFFSRGRLIWYCTQHGLFYQEIKR